MTRFDADARDPGLAGERTDLAWNRSALSLLACGAAILRGLERPSMSQSNVVIGLTVLALGVGVSALGAIYRRRVHSLHGRPARTADLAPISLGVALVGLGAFVVAAVSR